MMAENYIAQKRVLIFILVLYIFSLFLHINRIPLKFEEPRRALVALEMMHSGNYIVPTLNGINYYNKPPVFNWVLISLFKLTGSTSEWVVRLPTIISFLAIGWLIFIFSGRYLDRKIGLFATLFWLTSADIYFHFSIVGEIDLFFSLLVILQVFSIYHFYKSGRYSLLFLCSYFFMAAGVLTKGLPSIAFQALTLIAMAITVRKWKWLFHPAHFVSVLLAITIIGGYFYAYSTYDDVWPFLVRLFSESSNRTPISNGWVVTLQHVLVFPFMHIKLFLPWLLFAGVMIRKSAWQRYFSNNILKFAFYFCLLNIIPYWISPGTKDRYLYPFIPLVMIGVAWTFVNYYGTSRVSKWVNGVMLAFIFLFALLPFSFHQFQELDDIKWLWFKSAVFVVIFVLLGIAYFKQKRSRIWIFLLAFIFARVLFDLIIIPSRASYARENKKFKISAKEIADQTKNAHVFWLSEKEKLHRNIVVPKIFNKEVIVNEPKWADFALSFYFSKYHDSILTYTEHFKKGDFHLVLESKLPEIRDYEVVDKYYIPEKKRTYVLIK